MNIRRRDVVLGIACACSLMAAACATPLTSGGQYIQVNGSRQWVLRTGPIAAPTILVLHGGPGASETLLFRHFNRELETNLQMVYWDQRGAGRSYDPSAPPSEMNVEQFLSDLDVVVEYIRSTTNSQIFLLGHSWGSALGVIYTNRRPSKVRGFIGVNQVADAARQERASYAWCLSEAIKRKNSRALQALKTAGPPPFSYSALMVKNHWVEKFGGYFAHGFNKYAIALSAMMRGETSLGEVRRLIEANNFSLRAIYPETATLDLMQLVPSLSVPTAFLLGRHDRQCPADIAAEYYATLSAPVKELFWFENSAHNVPFEEPMEFNNIVFRLVSEWSR